MKGWINNLAMFCLIASASSSCCAQAQSSIVEYPRLGKQLRAPVIIENNESIDEFAPSSSQSTALSATSRAEKTPYFVEFGSVSQPVSLQPPNIRPSSTSSHIQEFGGLPLEAFEPSPGAFSNHQVFNKSRAAGGRKTLKVSQSNLTNHKTFHSGTHRAQAQLVPVDRLAIFPITERRNSADSRMSSATNLLSGKNRPSL